MADLAALKRGRWILAPGSPSLAPLALVAVAGLLAGSAWASGPTDIVRVDDFIGAPRAMFGRTGPQVEHALGPPVAVERGAVASYRDPAVFRAARRLSYQGLVIDVLDTGAVRRVRVQRAGLGWPLGLDIGSAREDVERVLGEPTQAEGADLMYLYSDGYPDTVHFHFQNGQVRQIEWNYGSAE